MNTDKINKSKNDIINECLVRYNEEHHSLDVIILHAINETLLLFQTEMQENEKVNLLDKGIVRLDYLEKLINSPELNDFLEGIRIEQAHQTEKWGIDSEERKYPHDYALIMDMLKGKQSRAIFDKDVEKYKHHLITLAAVCYNAHRQVSKEGTAINKFFTTK